MKAEEKRQLAVRVSKPAFEMLQRAAFVLRKTQGQIVEEALEEYGKAHSLGGRYELRVKSGYTVLVRLREKRVDVVDVHPLNGVPAEEIVQHYAVKVGAPVELVVEEEDHDDPTGAAPS